MIVYPGGRGDFRNDMYNPLGVSSADNEIANKFGGEIRILMQNKLFSVSFNSGVNYNPG